MAEIKKVTVDGTEFTFRNSFKSTRSGFSHTSEIQEGWNIIAEAKCNYLNRTWESYSFQTSMKCAVENAIAQREYDLIENFKTLNGIARTSKAQKELACKNDARIELLKKLLNEL